MRNTFGVQPNNLLCFSPVRWDYKLKRPQHLLLRFSQQTNVYFFEEPVFDAADESFLAYSTRSETLWKVVPHLKPGLTSAQTISVLTVLLDRFLENTCMSKWIFWYYTPYAMFFTKKHRPKLIIYDQLEDSANDFQEMDILNRRLLECADLIFKAEPSPEETPKKWDHLYQDIAGQIRNAVAGNPEQVVKDIAGR